MKLRMPASARQAGLGAGGWKAIYGFTLLAVGRALALVIMAEAVADGIASVVARTDAWHQAIALGIVGAVLRAAIAWATRTFATRSAMNSKEALRRDLAGRLLDDGAPSVGSAAVLGTHGLDELDNYYRSVLPAITSAAVIPILIGARLLFADWLSAVIIAITIILVPLFMALIGMHTSEKVSAATAALSRLSDHLVELARGLPVLIGLGRAEEQTEALREISDDYRAKTMKTLRVAFMSSLALELISTISVALVAVSIGLRLVYGDLSLEVALVVLILAPECFSPFRDLGASFHASQDGLGAMARARAIIDAPVRKLLGRRGGASDAAAEWAVTALTVRFSGRTTDAVHALSFEIPRLEITALQGLSGAGKSTVLEVLVGQLRAGEDVMISGSIDGMSDATVAWLPQHPYFVGDTVRAEMELYADSDAASSRSRIDFLLDQLGLLGVADDSPEQLSPGEARRLAFARMMLRVDAGATLVLLDEPTAHLDEHSAVVVQRMIGALRGRTTVVLVSHDLAVNALAHNFVLVGDVTGFRPSAQPERIASDPWEPVTPVRSVVNAVDSRSAVSALVRFLRPAAGRYAGAVALGTLAVLFAVSMTTVSGWLIVKASEHPSIMYLSVAIVGVRFFGIGRSALHYAERLVTHDAVLESVTTMRLTMWRSFIGRGATSRKMLGGATVLDNLIGAADHVRDLAPRVLIPATVAAFTSIAAVITVGVLDLAALPLIVACLVSCLIMAPLVTVAADRAASEGTARIQSTVLRQFAAALAAAGDLRANGIAPRIRARLTADDHTASLGARRSSIALGLGSAIIVLTCASTAVLTFMVTAPAVRAGTLPIETVAVLAFLPLALVECFLASTEALQQWPALAFQLRRVDGVFRPHQAIVADGDREIGAPGLVDLNAVSARWPMAPHPAISGVDLHATSEHWTVVSGPSGSGKSTLLTVLLGYLSVSTGSYSIDGTATSKIDPRSLRSRISWAPQDGYLFDSTLRGNLLIARSRNDAPSDAEMRSVLARVGLAGLVDTLADGLDTEVGPGGSRLSGGQRQRIVVARALLTRAAVVLLDEPTAHLDEVAAEELMADLRIALADRIVVLVTHHADELQPDDLRVILGADGRCTPERVAAITA
jgi:ATP-binding cassette subfamily C protein CydCD